MESIIEQLFKGEIDSLENFTKTDEYEKYRSEGMIIENEFLELIDQEQRKIYDKLADVGYQSSIIESKIHFVYGFKLGFRLAVELYNEDRRKSNESEDK